MFKSIGITGSKRMIILVEALRGINKLMICPIAVIDINPVIKYDIKGIV